MKFLFLFFLCLSMAFVSADTSIVDKNESSNKNAKNNSNNNPGTTELMQFRNNAMDALDNPYCRKRFRSYLQLNKPKVFIFATREKEKTAYCNYVASKTVEEAEKTVINRCEKKKKKSKKNKFTSPCRLFARNNILLLSRTDFDLKPPTKDLFYVVERYGVDEVKKVVETGVEINQKNDRGLTPLLIAVKENDLEVVKYLVSKGADLKLTNKEGDNALIIATKEKSDKIFIYLHSQGADINSTTSRTKRQPIHIASRLGYLGILDVIVNKGVDVNQTTIYKEIPLHLAIRSHFIPTVKYLLEKGANINAKDRSGNTSLDIAKKLHNKRMIDFLIKKGAM